jgi:hypothetical protein
MLLAPSSHLAQVRVPIGSGWAATDVIKLNEIATGSGVSFATKYIAFFGVPCGPSTAQPTAG